MAWEYVRELTHMLRSIPHYQVILADATERLANGLMYADFFDFT